MVSESVLDWPGNSTDLKSIENLWNNMKNKVAEKQPTSTRELECTFVKALKLPNFYLLGSFVQRISFYPLIISTLHFVLQLLI